ncbi:MAG: hypothetical protein JXB08_02765 [Bacilli bacterium]|nr:hypothetical protein [Bacilli bacterium]MBN2877878.1 hypothetical protein [Bacilli bacterium]
MDSKSLLRYVYITAIVAWVSLGLMYLFYTVFPVEIPFQILMILNVYLLPIWVYGLTTGVDKFAPQTDKKTQKIALIGINFFVWIYQPAVWLGLFGNLTDSPTKLILIGFPMLVYMVFVLIGYFVHFKKKMKFMLTLKNVIMTVYVLYLIILTVSMSNVQ